MSDEERDLQMWKDIRAALLLLVSAIETRYELGKHAPNKVVRPGPTDTIMVGERSLPNG